MENSTTPLFYYFGFPHYRKAILEQLWKVTRGEAIFMSGSSSRGNISTINEADFLPLRMLPSRSFGPFTWDVGAISAARKMGNAPVVLGPALSSLSTWIILLNRHFTKKRTYLWGQCGRPHDRSPRRFFQEVMNRLASAVLVYGKAEAEAAQELGLKSNRVFIVNNATESSQISLMPEYDELLYTRFKENLQKATKEKELRLLYVGRLVRAKRVDVLLDAALRLREEYPSLHVDIVGGGEEEFLLREKYKVHGFNFHGWIYDRKILESLYSKATFAVSPFHLGLFAIEALRYGTPVLQPDNPMNASEVEALKENTNSYVFSAGDSLSLAEAVPKALEIFLKVESEEYLQARREQLEIWTPEHVASNILEAISSRNL